MTQTPQGKPDEISIKDRLKDQMVLIQAGSLAHSLRAVPRGLYAGVGTCAMIAMLLMVVSFTVAKVVVHQGYQTLALATPATTGRLIRQNEVNHFGNRVSSAFGIKGSVATEFADWILEASERQQISPELLASLVVTESSFRKTARSSVGAVGPTQVRPDYWGKFCGDELHDPEQNVYCGAQVLSHLMERCHGDTTCALAAYNVGPYASRASAAQRYVQKIDGYLSSFDKRAL